MRDAVALALQHAFPSRIAGYNEAAAAARVGEARVAYLPDLSTGISASGYQRVVNRNYYLGSSLPDASLRGDSYDATLSASYVLLSTTRRLDVLSATIQREGLAASTEDARRAVVRNTATAYLRVVEADALLRLAEQDVGRRTRHLDESRALVRAGKRADYEVLRAEAELASAEASLVQARNGVRVARATLAQAVGRELPIDFTAETAPPPADPRGGSGPAVAREIVPPSLARRADVRAAGAEAEVARLELRRQERRYLPTLSLFARYNRVLDASQFDAFDQSYSYGGQLDVRFSDMLANIYRSKAVRARARAANIAEDQARVAAALEIERASLELDRSIEVSAATRKSLDAARRNYESTSERYRLGVATQTERVDAEASLVEAEVNAAKADVSYRVAIWNLRYEMGEPLDVP